MKVKITKAGDSSYVTGQVVELDKFTQMVKAILENGGEMPIAILCTPD